MRQFVGRIVRRRVSADEGYTLTEMLVVIAIIGIIAATLGAGLMDQLGRARAKTAQMQLNSVAAAVELFKSDTGRYPSTSEGLAALLADPGSTDGWTGPYLKSQKMLQDPWGHTIGYTLAGDSQTFTVISYGRDGAPSGAGLDRDLTAPQ
jgi:general secretion pathway protein G